MARWSETCVHGHRINFFILYSFLILRGEQVQQKEERIKKRGAGSRHLPRLYRQRSLRGRLPFRPPRRYTWPESKVALCLLLEGGAGPFSVPAAVTELHIFPLRQNGRLEVSYDSGKIIREIFN